MDGEAPGSRAVRIAIGPRPGRLRSGLASVGAALLGGGLSLRLDDVLSEGARGLFEVAGESRVHERD